MSADFDRLLRDAVHDLAQEGRPVDLSTPALRTARNIRTRRAVSAVASLLVVVVGLAFVVSRTRSTAEPVPPAEQGASPSVSAPPSPTPSASAVESADPGTAPIVVAGGWMIRGAPAVDDAVIVYDDDAGRYRKVGVASTALPSPNGRYLATVGETGVMVTAVADRRLMYEGSPPLGSVRPVWSPDSSKLAYVTDQGVRVRVVNVADGTESTSDPVRCPDGCVLKWLDDGRHIRVYTGSNRAELAVTGISVGPPSTPPSTPPDDPCGSTVRAFRIDTTSFICVTTTGFAVTTAEGRVTQRIPFPKAIDGMTVASGSVNYVLFRPK